MADKVVSIPGVGNVSFPDTMSEDQIRVTIQGKILPQAFKTAPEKTARAMMSPEQQKAQQKTSQVIQREAPAKDPGVLSTLITAGAMIPAQAIRGVMHPWETLQDVWRGQKEQAQQIIPSALEAYEAMGRGQVGTGLIRGMEPVGRTVATALPAIGPAAAQAGEHIGGGQPRQGFTEAGLLLAPEIPKIGRAVLGRAGILSDPFANRLTPVEEARLNEFDQRAQGRAQLTFGQKRGIEPIKRGERTMRYMLGASTSAEEVFGAQERELARQAKESIGKAAPKTVGVPVEAGEQVRDAFEGHINRHRSAADDIYDDLRREAAAAPETIRIGTKKVIQADGTTTFEPIEADYEAPVPLKPIRTNIKPLHDRLRGLPEAQRQAMPGWAQLDRIMTDIDPRTGKPPMFINAMDLDRELGAIKQTVREAERSRILTTPAARLQLRLIDAAERSLKPALDRIRPGAYDDLLRARTHVKAYSRADALLTRLMGGTGRGATPEPARIYREMISAHDAHYYELQRIHQIAPKASRTLARSYLEGMLQEHMPSGRLERTAGLLRAWEQLGPKTKKLWYGDALTRELDTTFRNIKDLMPAEGSPTAFRLPALQAIMGIIAGHPLLVAKEFAFANVLGRILFSPGGGTMMTRALRSPVSSALFREAMRGLTARGIIAANEEEKRIRGAQATGAVTPAAPTPAQASVLPEAGPAPAGTSPTAAPTPPAAPAAERKESPLAPRQSGPPRAGGHPNFSKLYEFFGKAYGVPPALLRTVALLESGGNPEKLGSSGEVGLMQLMPATARTLGVTDRRDPQESVRGAAKFLGQLMEKYGGDMRKVLAAYNEGETAYDKRVRLGKPLPPTTQAYVSSGLRMLGQWEMAEAR